MSDFVSEFFNHSNRTGFKFEKVKDLQIEFRSSEEIASENMLRKRTAVKSNKKVEFEKLFGFYPTRSAEEAEVLTQVFYQLLIVRRSARYSSISNPSERLHEHLGEIRKFERMAALGSQFYPQLSPILDLLQVPVEYHLPQLS